jgi:hypothetical protein
MVLNGGQTFQDGSISSQESIFQGLFNITLLKSFLLGDYLVHVLASKQSHLVASMSIVHAEE